MSENGCLLLHALTLLVDERTKPKEEQSLDAIERYTDTVIAVTETILLEEPVDHTVPEMAGT